MIKKLLLAALAGGLTAASQAQAQTTPASLTTSPYSQNFNTLANSGASNAKATLPAGWDFTEVGTSATADGLYAADNGANNAGNVYSYGPTSGTDRALGSLLSGSLTPTLGAAFTNNTGAALTKLTFSYVGETWRIGGTGRADKLTFQYSTDATALDNGTWTSVTALDYANTAVTATVTSGVSTPIQTATIAPVDVTLSTALAVGSTIWIRWNDFNAAGSDDGLAVDDFSLSWDAGTPGGPTLTPSVSTLSFGNQNINTTSTTQTYSLAGASLTGATTLTVTGPFTISKDNLTFGTSLTYSVAELATAQTVSVRFTPTATGAATGSISHTSAGATAKTVTLSGNGVDPNQTTFSFNTCTTALSDGWSQYSVTGAQVWACTTFGHDPSDATGTASLANGVQMNGYASGNVANEDWFISPAFDLSTYTYPLFSFWSRTAFNGPTLKLRVSTNYSGSGAPSAATWTELNVPFPANGSDVWTKSPQVNLAAFIGTKVYVAFVYTSTTSAAARWTLDDIALTKSATPPAPSLFADASRLAFGYQAVSTNGDRTLSVSANDLTGDVTLTSSNAAFTVSKDGTTFASSIVLTKAEVNGTSKTVTVRFRPTTANAGTTGTLALTTPGAAAALTIALSGDTYDPAKTLELVNWNVEWFGTTASGFGPTDKNLQQANVTTVLTSLAADVYALEEVVDTVRLRNVVAQLSTNLGTTYAYKISEFGSYADNPADADYPLTQKLAFIYRTSVVKNPSFQGLLRCTEAQNCEAFRPWASGRFPYMMSADVTLDGNTKRVNFIVIHAKANSAATSADDYARRKKAADLLKNLLDTSYPTANTVIVGDYNDILEGTIATGVTPAVSSYSSFLQDAANYVPITLPLAQAGLQSTASYKTVIDHVIANKNMAQYFIPGTAAIRTDVTSAIASYATTTSDHYPVFSRYSATAVLGTKAARAASLGLYPNPVTNAVRFDVPETGSNLRLQVHTLDGRLVLSGTGSVEQLNQQLGQRVAGLSSGLYLIRVVGAQQTYTDRFQKQ